MRISNINPKYLKLGDKEKLEGGQTVPFFKGRVRLADADEIEAIEIEYGRDFECSPGFIPIVWVE